LTGNLPNSGGIFIESEPTGKEVARGKKRSSDNSYKLNVNMHYGNNRTSVSSPIAVFLPVCQLTPRMPLEYAFFILAFFLAAK
jgi:hypothetical protein